MRIAAPLLSGGRWPGWPLPVRPAEAPDLSAARCSLHAAAWPRAPSLRRAPSLAWMGLLLSLRLASSQVSPLECPGAGLPCRVGEPVSMAVPCPRSHGLPGSTVSNAGLVGVACESRASPLRFPKLRGGGPEAPHFLVVLGS